MTSSAYFYPGCLLDFCLAIYGLMSWGGGGGGAWEWGLFDDFSQLILYKGPYFYGCVLLINQRPVGEGWGSALQSAVRAYFILCNFIFMC